MYRRMKSFVPVEKCRWSRLSNCPVFCFVMRDCRHQRFVVSVEVYRLDNLGFNLGRQVKELLPFDTIEP